MDKNKRLQKQRKQIKFHVDSKYSILETIGSGAYGVVCSAVDDTNGQRVAIKKISNVFDVPSITKRTLRELKILKHFKHDNIISIKEILRPPEDLSTFSDVYIVLDLMGSDLHHIIHSKQDLSIEHIRYFLYQLLRGLKYIHSSNIIHRDLKPSNLLINKDCELKIGDFGMARSLSASASEKKRVMTEYVATRWYRAPELMLSLHQFTKAIDVWSVGCIFAEMIGRAPLFPGSNYLNQLQLILSVVGIPSLEFMATITSEKIRNYIGRLPHKEAVPFEKLYENASSDTIDLLGKFLVLDPKQRCSVESALEHSFLEKYHDLDDEPTCPLFTHDIESIPLDRNILRSHILKEIQEYHTKRPKPKLTPVETKFLQPFMTPGNNMKNGKPKDSTNKNEVIQVDPKLESRKSKRKQPNDMTNIITNVIAKRKSVENADPGTTSKSLSDQDKEILERWRNMQKRTKPFVHPIRKHMDDLKKLKNQSTILPQTIEETAKGQAIVDRVSGLQFTNFVAQNKNGLVSLVREQTVRLPNSNLDSLNAIKDGVTVQQMKSQKDTQVAVQSNQVKKAEDKPTANQQSKQPLQPQRSSQQQQQAILVPLGSVPVFQVHNGPIVFLPKFAPAQKVNLPIPIAPKPPMVSTPASVNVSTTTGNSIRTILLPQITQTNNAKSGSQDVIIMSSDASNSLANNKPINEHTVLSARSSSSGERSQYGLCSSDGKSSTLVSASSILSEISINSSELNSSENTDDSANMKTAINEEKVLADVKKLDERDKKIVSIIENLTNDEKQNSQSKSTKVSRDSADDVEFYREGLDNDQHSNNDTSPVTTLANVDTNSWSIVKNMLVNAIKAKKEKDDVEYENNNNDNLQNNNLNNFTNENPLIQSNWPIPMNNVMEKPLTISNKRSNVDSPELFIMSSSKSTSNVSESVFVTDSKNSTHVSVPSNTPNAAQINNAKNDSLNNTMQYDKLNNQLLNSFTKNESLLLSNMLTNNPMFCADQNTQQVRNQDSSTVANDNKSFDWLNILTSQSSVDDEWTSIVPYSSDESNLDFNLLNSLALEFPNQTNYLKTPKSANINFLSEIENEIRSDNTPVLLTPRIGKSENPKHLELGKSLSNPIIPTRYEDEREKDVFLTTLVDTPKTPRSGAAAYGLGMNLEDLFSGANFDSPVKAPSTLKQINLTKTVAPDQTPLSATLLNDWLGGTDIEPLDIVDLQKELETTSTSLLFDK